MKIRTLLSRVPFVPIEEAPPVVAVLRLAGVIGSLGPLRSGLTLSGLAGQIDRAFKLPRLEAVALVINSPGGSPVQSALIAGRIRDLAAEKGTPVYAFAEDVAASGGYWLACAGDKIYANENSIIGSIGVVSAGFGFPELLKRLGIERRIHTAGEKKAMLDPFLDEEAKDVSRLKTIQKDIHESFKSEVRARRGDRLTGTEKTLFSGEFWTGRRALELGLVDALGEVRQVMRERYGEKVKLKVVDGERSWLRRRFRLETREPTLADVGVNLLAAAEARSLWARFGL